MRTINMTFEDKEFNKIEKEKEECAKARKQRLSWEDFALIKFINKTI